MDKIKELSSSIEVEIEKNLYCIKSCNYKCDDEFIKVFGFKFIIRPSQEIESDICVELNNCLYIIEIKSRLITFIINKVEHVRFIYSCEYLKDVINEYEIQYLSIKNEKFDNSLESEISNLEIYDLYNNEDIKKIYKVESNYNILIKLFDKRRIINSNKISKLSLNAGDYYPEHGNDELELKIFNYYSQKLKKYVWNDFVNIIYLVGPKGVSKSLFLMYFSLNHNIKNNPTLYINYKKLKNSDYSTMKYLFEKEMIYLFFDVNSFKDFYIEKHYKFIKDKNHDFVHNLTEFTKKLINIYKNYFRNKITLIIDNFEEDNENIFDEMEKLIKFVNANSSQLRLIISGNGNFLIKKFKLFLINKNLSNIIENQALFIYEPKLENHNEIKSLAAFNYRKNIKDEELEDILIKEEVQYCKKFNLYGMHYSVINNGKKIKLDDLLKYIQILPFEYLTFSLNGDESITFEYFNPVFLKAVKKSIKSKIKEHSIKFLLSNDNADFLIKEIYEEKLLTTLISYNKLNLENMNTSENNLLEVTKLSEFKDKKFVKTNKIIDKTLPIIITQEIFLGEFYDLLILVPNKLNDIYYFTGYMTQIGTNKPKNKIEEIKSDFNPNIKNYISGIKKFVDNGIEINNLELLFIFDKETQEKLKSGKIYESGSKYCLLNKIKFYCFSVISYELYKTFDNKKYTKINNFGDFNKSNKRKWSDYSFLSEEEIKFINSKSSDDVANMWICIKTQIKFQDIKQNIEKDKIYILENQIDKYFIINSIFYKYEENNFIEINKKNIEKNEKFDLLILSSLAFEIGFKKK